ncbi:hypothetical protein ACLI09_12295 [Flavobacterium sp. RHBU_24]|uniref:hypothetical protein n=1 Tax=Flavobacterium sp. RHBU_24 TaxID=3391185 RepID=UPI003984A0B2
MRVTGSAILVLILFMITCCGPNKEDALKVGSAIKAKYFKMEQNGWKSFTHTQNIDEINYTATQVPLDYYILKKEGIDDLNKADSISKANEEERIIEFEFLHEEEQDLLKDEKARLDYESAIKYMSFNIKDDFYLVTASHDTIRSEGVLFERTFNVSPSNKLLIFFSGVKANQPVQLVYDDKLFGKGVLKFNFKEKITKILL